MALSKTIVEEGILSEINFQLGYGDSSKALEVLIEYREWYSRKLIINELERLVSESTIDTTCDEDDIDYQEISLHDTLERIKELKQN